MHMRPGPMAPTPCTAHILPNTCRFNTLFSCPFLFCTPLVQVGRFEDPEDAARSRDLAMLGLGNSRAPKLNFDADDYTTSQIELLVGAAAPPPL